MIRKIRFSHLQRLKHCKVWSFLWKAISSTEGYCKREEEKKTAFALPKIQARQLRRQCLEYIWCINLANKMKYHFVFIESKSVIKVIFIPMEHRSPWYKYLSADGPAQPGESWCQRVSSQEKPSADKISSRMKVEMDAIITPCVCCRLASERQKWPSDCSEPHSYSSWLTGYLH